MKKFILAAVLGYLFFQIVMWANQWANKAFFDEFYTSDYEVSDSLEPNVIEKAIDYVKGLFEEEEQEKYIYR